MQKIRIQNDITIRATVTRKKVAEDFTGKELRLILRSQLEVVNLPFTIEGNTLTALWLGSEQTRTGVYTVTLVEDMDGGSRNTADSCMAFALVPRSCDEAEALTGSQTVDVDIDVSVPSNGLSAYELARLHGYEGTEEEWLDSIKGNAELIENFRTRIERLEDKTSIIRSKQKIQINAGDDYLMLAYEGNRPVLEMHNDGSVMVLDPFSLVFRYQAVNGTQYTRDGIRPMTDEPIPVEDINTICNQ